MDNVVRMFYNFDFHDRIFVPPSNLLTQELSGLYGSRVLREQREIINYYDIYDNGVKFNTKVADNDSRLPDLRFRTIKQLIDKEARFMMARTPDFDVSIPKDYTKEVDESVIKLQQSLLQSVLDKVLSDNKIGGQLVKAAKDCLIGKRVACILNFDNETGVTISFIPSLEFVYEQDDSTGDLTKIICYYMLNDVDDYKQQKIYKKKYWMNNGICYVSEAIYNGVGALIEELIPETKTALDFIPAQVILNDGLLGDTDGESEIKDLIDSESWESRINCKDIAALEKSMNPTRYIVDASPSSTKGLSIAAGSLWDIASSEDTDNQASLGTLESSMTYSTPLDNTLKRIRHNMYGIIDMPEINLETMLGAITSGKGMRAVYWGLITRIDEKMLAWNPALQKIAEMIFKGIKAYPDSLNKHGLKDLQIPFDVKFDVNVVNRYPIPEDEETEKQTDIMEVNAQVKSKKSYLMKWGRMTEEEADAEIEQIAKEKQLLESMDFSFNDVVAGEETGEEE